MAGLAEREAVSFSEIDSERFGVRVARAPAVRSDLSEILAFCTAEKIDLLIARSATSEVRQAQEMEALGFLLMDALIYYTFDLGKRTIPDDIPRVKLRMFQPSDEQQVGRVAAESFKGYFGHYHADPRLETARCDEGYISWAVRSCTSKQVATEVLVAENDYRVLGFATLRLNSSDEGEGVLFAVAPEAQGMGIYRSFMVAGLKWCKEQLTKRMIVSTQITNVAVQKVWCRVGFEPSHSYYTFHKWFRNGGQNGRGHPQ